MEGDCLKINKLDTQQNRNGTGCVSLRTKHPRKFQVPPRFTTFQDVMPGLHVRGWSRSRRVPGSGTLPRRHAWHWTGAGQGTQSSPLASKTKSRSSMQKSRQGRCVYSGSNPLAGRRGGCCSHTSRLIPIENPPISTPASQDQDPAVSSPWSSLCPDTNSIMTKTCLRVLVDLFYSVESMYFISI